MERNFTKLSDLVGKSFTVNTVDPFVWKMWNQAEKKMETSDTWQEGYRKVYPVQTNKGSLDMGSGQIGSLLEAVFYKGKADLVGKTFFVKSNGKSGMDIRYYFNVVKEEPVIDINDDIKKEVSIDDIPF